MTERIAKLAQQALAGDSFPEPVPYAAADASEKRDPLAIARGIEAYLLAQPVDIREGELLADRFRFAHCDVPGDFYKRTGHDHTNRAWNACCYRTHPNDLFYWGWTHLALDYGAVLTQGLRGFLARVEASRSAHAGSPGRLALLEGMALCLKAIGRRGRLCAEACERLAESCGEGSGRLLAMAARCRKVPMEPAESFFEAIQSVWSMFLINPDSLGRIDQYLYPYYRRETEAGTLSRAVALEWLQELFVKVFETQVNNLALPISGHNHLVVGGYLQDGRDGYNELSALILEAIAELPTFRPQVSFRYTNQTTAQTLRYVTALNRRCPLIVFVNDEPRLAGMVRAGIRREDALEYTVVGCNEWSICGKSKVDLAHISLVHALTELYKDRQQLCQAMDFEAVYSLFEDSLRADILRIAQTYVLFQKEQAKDLNVLTSALIDDCIERAQSYTQGGARYDGLSFSFNGLSNVADSLSVIRQFVFDEGRVSMAKLLDALESDWQGHEALRGEVLRSGRFFGNNDPYADCLAGRILESIDRCRADVRALGIRLAVFGSFVGATHPNIVLGKATPATPDGRHAGDAFTMGISQSEGRDRRGITALLQSIASLDYEKFCGCIVSNLKMDPSMADTEEKLDRIAQLFHTFLRLGGMQLQINYVSAKDLLEAQAHPEAYRNLMVRVTGYSGYFTLFDRDLQDDIIRRTAYQHA